MKKVELLLPAGNERCLRAVVNNGADAVYLGLSKFNARTFANNFNENNIFSIVEYCHKHKVKVYVTFNTLIKNDELKDFFELMNIAYSAKIDAVIIQDINLIKLIRNNFPGLEIHLSTQSTITNTDSVPKDVDRVILPRELSLQEITQISKTKKTEIFIHGALCISYSGQCLFSSIVGGRSGNRGKCAQPCRKQYNNKYLLSTMDLCLINRLPELIKTGTTSLKIEGRMRSPFYVATVAKIYKKYLNLVYSKKPYKVDDKDLEQLMLAFNREFTEGFAFNLSITDSKTPGNRGICLGKNVKGKLKLRTNIQLNDKIKIWYKDNIQDSQITNITKNSKKVKQAQKGDIIDLGVKDDVYIYKYGQTKEKLDLGEPIQFVKPKIKKKKLQLPKYKDIPNNDNPKLFIKVYNKKNALKADEAKADIIYYDILKDDCLEVKSLIKNSEFFVFTPKIINDEELPKLLKKIKKINPSGVLVSNRGFLSHLNNYQLHLDYSFNTFNDIDINNSLGIPIISPELNFKEIEQLKNKNVIILVHGNLTLMTTKQPLKTSELIDEDGRHFNVRHYNNVNEILNNKQLGLFNKIKKLEKSGLKYFYLDISNDADKFIRIYRKILDDKPFDDKKISRGYTTGHFSRGVE